MTSTTKTVYTVIAAISVTMFGPAGESAWAQYPCKTMLWVPPVSVPCVCTSGTCPSQAIVTQGYYTCVPSSSGLQVCLNTPTMVGSSFPCALSYNWGVILSCAALSGVCGFICGTAVVVPNPANIAACLACIASVGAGCFGCAIVTCTQATTGTPIFANVTAVTGGQCP